MDAWQRFERLAAEARQEPAPRIEVRDSVLRSLRQATESEAFDPPLWVFSGISLLAASIAAMMAFESWSAISDPLTGFFDSLIMVMQ